jgi:hypothetical protein
MARLKRPEATLRFHRGLRVRRNPGMRDDDGTDNSAEPGFAFELPVDMTAGRQSDLMIV